MYPASDWSALLRATMGICADRVSLAVRPRGAIRVLNFLRDGSVTQALYHQRKPRQSRAWVADINDAIGASSEQASTSWDSAGN